MLNIYKKIIIIYLILLIIKKKIFKNINGDIKKKFFLIKIKNKKIKIKNLFKKNIIYFGYILCSNKCPKIIKKVQNIKKGTKNFIFLSINKNENLNIIEKNLNKIKKNNIYGINNNEKKINNLSKNFKIIFKYKNNKINHSNIIYNIKFKKSIFKNKK